MKNYFPKPLIAFIVIVLIVGGIYWLESRKAAPSGSIPDDTSINIENAATEQTSITCERRPAQQIVNPSGYVNAIDKPITIKEYVGKKVILVDFMTYSCINCQHTFPYLTAWYEKYKDAGLQIIGIQTPEFDFEKKRQNVIQAMKKFGIEYPVVLDNDYGTWRAYNNHYWPHKFIIGINGCIVYDHIGEGGYKKTERVIQALLKKREEVLGLDVSIPDGFVDPEAETRARETRTGEIYFGANRNNVFLANGNAGEEGVQTFSIPENLVPDKLYLGGKWNIEGRYAEALEAGAKIKIHYKAQVAYAVLGAPDGAKITIRQDGVLVKTVTLKNEELYRLVENPGVGSHTLTITAREAGLRAFTFVFE